MYLMRVIVFLNIFLLCSCSLIIPIISYPTSPTALEDTYQYLAFDYKYKNKSIHINRSWKCTYTKAWAANNGWSISSKKSSYNFIEQLEPNVYLYIKTPSCSVRGNFIPDHIEFDIQNAELTINSASFFSPYSCGFHEGENKIINSHVLLEWFSPNKKLTPLKNEEVLLKLKSYDIYVLPIDKYHEKVLTKKTELWGNLHFRDEIISSREYNSLYGTTNCPNCSFPYLSSINPTSTFFANHHGDGWDVTEEKGPRFYLHKKNAGRLPSDNIFYQGLSFGSGASIFVPSSSSIFSWRRPVECSL